MTITSQDRGDSWEIDLASHLQSTGLAVRAATPVSAIVCFMHVSTSHNCLRTLKLHSRCDVRQQQQTVRDAAPVSCFAQVTFTYVATLLFHPSHAAPRTRTATHAQVVLQLRWF